MNIRSLMDDYLVALRFFSRIKVSDRLLSRAAAGEHSMDFSKAGGVAPLVGLSIALPSCIALILLSTAGVNIYVNAALALALLAILTGALHDDGLADCADGFFVQGGRDKKLAIMADSRLGTFGALALFFVNATHIFLLGALLEQLEAPLAAFCLAFAQALSRYLLLCCWYFQPLARNEGLAAKAYLPEAQSLLMGGVIIAVIWLLSGLWIPLGASLAAILLAILAATGVAMLAGAKINGVTGDVLGAIQQLSALALMLGFHLFA